MTNCLCAYKRVISVFISRGNEGNKSSEHINSSSRQYTHCSISYTTWWAHKQRLKRRFEHMNIAFYLVRLHSADDVTIVWATLLMTSQLTWQLWRVLVEEICIFLHDRSLISPWTKSISNELDITVHVIAPQLSDHCDVINIMYVTSSAERKPREWDTGTMCKDRRFYRHLWIHHVV